MLLFEEAGAAMTGEDVVRVIVAILTALAALLAPRLGARHDDLEQAERLTTLLPDLASPERELLHQLRDDHAVVWALRQAAPVLPRDARSGQVRPPPGLDERRTREARTASPRGRPPVPGGRERRRTTGRMAARITRPSRRRGSTWLSE
ncbi:hypothetical protein [Agromyces sp. NPDC049794]|uniref:hypothetical protein n=1 Tax=unclassified Agromyces TaxID=2639701 RepID=UPI0033D6EC37